MILNNTTPDRPNPPPHSWLKKSLWLILAITLACSAYWVKNHKTIPMPTPTTPFSVTVVEPQLKIINSTLHLSGLTVAHQEALICSDLSGLRINAIFTSVGKSVKKGQVLATLDNANLVNEVKKLDHEYRSLRDEYERIQKLKYTGSFSEQVIIQKKQASLASKIMLDNAQLTLKKTKIVAPFDGLVFDQTAIIGDLITANQPLFRITKGIEIEMEVPEKHLTNIKLGQSATLFFQGHAKLTGKVYLISPQIKANRRTASVRITLDQPTILPIGLYGEAEITTNKITGLVLPETALQSDSLGTYVWQVDSHHQAVRKNIEVLSRTHGEIIIRPPLEGKVVAKMGTFIKNGDKLRIVKPGIFKPEASK